MLADFDPQSRPQLSNGSRCAVRFPFNAWEGEYRYTMPDLLMSFPGVQRKTRRG